MTRKPLALVVDANAANREKLAARLQLCQFDISQSKSLRDANAHLDQVTPDLAIIALDLPDGDGLTLLKHPGLDNSREIILINDEDDPDRVRRGVLAGASYFFCRPAHEQFLNGLLHDLATEFRSPAAASLRAASGWQIEQFGLLYGSSPPMHKLYRDVRKLAACDASVYLIGEKGTGKELVARTIHQLSERSSAPFVAFNCAAFAPDSIESQLFGHGASELDGSGREASGYLGKAYGGTLFLDEITELSNEMQIRLLHTLETRCLRPSERDRDSRTDLRIMAATSRDTEDTVHARQLREDLFFRIASFPLHIPPLRTRGDDIQGLAQLFVAEFNRESDTEKVLTHDAAAVLKSCAWPGNVRELRSVMERAYIIADQEIAPEHLPDLSGEPADNGDVLQLNIGDSVQDAEKKLTLATLTFYNGDKRKAAQTLGVSLKTLYNRINAYQAKSLTSSVSRAVE